jgi:hypothetical protein
LKANIGTIFIQDYSSTVIFLHQATSKVGSLSVKWEDCIYKVTL